MTQKELGQLSDEELATLIGEDKEYFAHIIGRYQNKLFAFITRLTSISKEETEDLLQEIFILAYRNIHDFDPNLKFSSWIYRIARNQVISHHRKIKVRPKFTGLEPAIYENIASEFDLNKLMENKELKRIIAQTFEKMDTKYKEILLLKFVEEKSYEEISDILKKPKGTIGTMINRAKKQFSKIIKTYDR
ncbi:RNA polymerase sigma factor [Candidatus Nomurabacteria bacterium]|nr:RNA polymerase sigma factor [Candidatus Nomurabacteria bacterium]